MSLRVVRETEVKILMEEANGHNSLGQGGHRFLDVSEEPMPTIQAGRPVNMIVSHEVHEQRKESGTPLYRVPLMTEIAAIPWNGFSVVSTFSGCGGSCLGYR